VDDVITAVGSAPKRKKGQLVPNGFGPRMSQVICEVPPFGFGSLGEDQIWGKRSEQSPMKGRRGIEVQNRFSELIVAAGTWAVR